MSKVGVHLIVEGRVQGVGFRYFTQKIGLTNNITGYVKNLSDGSVEIVAEGEQKNINQFILSVQNNHPYAKVINIKKGNLPVSGTYRGFEIKY